MNKSGHGSVDFKLESERYLTSIKDIKVYPKIKGVAFEANSTIEIDVRKAIASTWRRPGKGPKLFVRMTLEKCTFDFPNWVALLFLNGGTSGRITYSYSIVDDTGVLETDTISKEIRGYTGNDETYKEIAEELVLRFTRYK
jgi:hypothetical protein